MFSFLRISFVTLVVFIVVRSADAFEIGLRVVDDNYNFLCVCCEGRLWMQETYCGDDGFRVQTTVRFANRYEMMCENLLKTIASAVDCLQDVGLVEKTTGGKDGSWKIVLLGDGGNLMSQREPHLELEQCRELKTRIANLFEYCKDLSEKKPFCMDKIYLRKRFRDDGTGVYTSFGDVTGSGLVYDGVNVSFPARVTDNGEVLKIVGLTNEYSLVQHPCRFLFESIGFSPLVKQSGVDFRVGASLVSGVLTVSNPGAICLNMSHARMDPWVESNNRSRQKGKVSDEIRLDFTSPCDGFRLIVRDKTCDYRFLYCGGVLSVVRIHTGDDGNPVVDFHVPSLCLVDPGMNRDTDQHAYDYLIMLIGKLVRHLGIAGENGICKAKRYEELPVVIVDLKQDAETLRLAQDIYKRMEDVGH